MGGFSIWHGLILLVVVALVFGTKRLRNVGEDVGAAIKGFRKGIQDGDGQPQLKADPSPNEQQSASSESKTERAE